MLGRHVPSDFWFVCDNMPFCIHVGGRVIIMYAFDQWHFGDPSVVGRTFVGGIVGVLMLLRGGRRCRWRMNGCRECLLPFHLAMRRMRIWLILSVQAFCWELLFQALTSVLARQSKII